MIPRIISLAAAILTLAITGSALADLDSASDVTFTVAREKLDDSSRQAGKDSAVTVETRELVYKVTVTNASFKPMPTVVVKYNIYYTVTEPGETKTKIGTTAGSHTLQNVGVGADAIFDTDPFKLQSSQLAGGWYYGNGAPPAASDQALGYWFKAFDASGKLLGEYMNPDSLARKVTWKDPQN